MSAERPDMSVQIGSLKLRNPVMTASGTFGYGLEYAELVDLERLGAVVIKAVTLEPRVGNRPPRIAETAAGMLNAIGLQNPGVDQVIAEKLPELAGHDVPIIANLAGESVSEYVQLAEKLSECGQVAALELNISCPNVAHGMMFGTSGELTAELVSAVRRVTDLPLMTKLSPNVTDIVSVALAATEAGSDALSLVNTLMGMSIDVARRRPMVGNITAGLSGPAIKPVALRCVWQVYEAVQVPLVGMGGIMDSQDALQFIMAGANAVAVGTANFVNPAATVEIITGLEQYCAEQNVPEIASLVGVAHR
jgi:dihydroorotate dehydrogenase (NAD+) catalytic subunit